MPDITVPVPADRTAEFYQFFGLWLAGSLSLSAISAGTSQSPAKTLSAKGGSAAKTIIAWTGGDQDAVDAEALWLKFSSRARAFFGLLMDNPDTKYTGEQIAEAVNIPNGSHGVAGVLAWPGRFCAPRQRELPSSWEEDADSGESYYWMKPEVAELFKAARAKVEGAG